MADPNRPARWGPPPTIPLVPSPFTGPRGSTGHLPPGMLPPPASIFGGGTGRKGPSGWAQLAILVVVVVLATAGWSIWSLVNVSSSPGPRPPVAVPSPTSTPPSPTTAASPSTTPSATPTPTPSASSSGAGRPVGPATQVPATPSPVLPVGTQPARVRFDVASSAGTGDVNYGSNSKADVHLADQRMPFAVEVTVPRDTEYAFILGSDYGRTGADTTMRCRVYVNEVLVVEQLSRSSCIAGVNLRSVFGS